MEERKKIAYNKGKKECFFFFLSGLKRKVMKKQEIEYTNGVVSDFSIPRRIFRTQTEQKGVEGGGGGGKGVGIKDLGFAGPCMGLRLEWLGIIGRCSPKIS